MFLDEATTSWINSFAGQSDSLDSLMVAISIAGIPVIIMIVILQWWSLTDAHHVRHSCVASGLAFLLGLAINQIILLFVHRIRPYDNGVTHLIVSKSMDWSFPSDHATAAIAIAAIFFLKNLKGRAIALGILGFLVCVSRVYVGTHYVTDVLGGAITGILSALFICCLYREGSKWDRFITNIL